MRIEDPRSFIETGTYLLLGMVPLIFSVQLEDSFAVPKTFLLRLLTVVIFLFWSYSILRGEKMVPRSGPFGFFVLANLLLVFSSTMFSRSVVASLGFFYDTLCFAALYFIWVGAFRIERVRSGLTIIFLAGALSSTYALLQHAGVDIPNISWSHPELVRVRSIGTFGNPDFLAGYLVAALPIGSYLLLSTIGFSSFCLLLLAWFLCLGAMLFSYSRGGWVAFAASTAFFLFFLRKDWRIWRGRLLVMIGIFLLCTFLFCAVAIKNEGPFNLLTRLQNVFNFKESNIATRLYLWHVALLVAVRNPILGTGPETFPLVSLPYRYLEPVDIRGRFAMPERAHNEFLEIACSTGFPNLATNGLLLFLLFWKTLKLLRNLETGEERLRILAMASAALSHWTSNFFLYSTTSTNLVWVFLLSGLTSANRISGPRAFRRSSSPVRIVVLVALVLLGALVVYLNYRNVRGNYYFKQGQVQREMKKWKDSLRSFDLAIENDPSKSRYWLHRGKLLEEFFISHPDKRDIPEVQKSYLRAAEIDPLNPYPLADLGRFLGYLFLHYDKSCGDAAEKAYLEALKRDPYNPCFYNDLANLYAQMHRDQDALACYRRSLGIYPYSTHTNFNLGLFYFIRGKCDVAEKYFEESLRLDAGNKRAKKMLDEIRKK